MTVVVMIKFISVFHSNPCFYNIQKPNRIYVKELELPHNFIYFTSCNIFKYGKDFVSRCKC